MELFADICGFLGAWLLVAGPIYQASLELREQDLETERIQEAGAKVMQPKKVSVWWWLLPPLKIFLEHRRSNRYRREYIKVLHSEDVEALINFINKATGWLLVAGGASLIAVKETFELTDHLDSPHYLFWVVVPLMMFISIMYTIARTVRTKRIIEVHGSDARA
jgi:hypothetical protein